MSEAINPIMSVLKKAVFQSLYACRSIFAENFNWHYFQPKIAQTQRKELMLIIKNFLRGMSRILTVLPPAKVSNCEYPVHDMQNGRLKLSRRV